MTSHRHRITAIVAAILATATSAARAEAVFYGVAAGDLSATDAILWTRAENGGNATDLMAQIATDPEFAAIVTTLNGTTSAEGDFTLKLDATGLTSNTHYYYRFVASDGKVSGTGQFTTAPMPSEKVEVRSGFSGDADSRFRPYPSIASIASQKLSYFIFLGDTMYETASLASPEVPVITGQTTDPAALTNALSAYDRKYLENLLGVNSTNGQPAGTGQQSLQPLLAATGTYTLLDNHELGNQAMQSGGAPPDAPFSSTDPVFDINNTGRYNNKTAAFRTVVKSYLDYHPTRQSMIGSAASGYVPRGPQVDSSDDHRSDATPRLYFAQQWGANSLYIQTDDRSYRDIRLSKPRSPGANTTTDDVGPRADNPHRTMLGSTQLQWLESSLLQARKDGIPWKFVAISSPIDQVGRRSGTGRQSNGQPDGTQSPDGKSWWGGYRSERDRLLKFIADNKIDHVVFLTTDDHMVRVTQLQYRTDPNIPDGKALVPNAFQIAAGPIGAGRPDGFTDHSFATMQTAAESRNASQLAMGEPQLGLPPDFPGLRNVFREGDPTASASPSPVDFMSFDTFNYVTLKVAIDGSLTVDCWGVPSYQPNTFPQNPVKVTRIFSFQIGL
jgi:alkaline phosphatase D